MIVKKNLHYLKQLLDSVVEFVYQVILQDLNSGKKEMQQEFAE